MGFRKDTKERNRGFPASNAPGAQVQEPAEEGKKVRKGLETRLRRKRRSE